LLVPAGGFLDQFEGLLNRGIPKSAVP